MSEVVISVKGVAKYFEPSKGQRSIKQAVTSRFKMHRNDSQKKGYWALKDINFEVKKGEFFGIVGRNGSGKSTLLKMIAGIYSPTKGRIKVNGKLVPFIELGVGFNPELTGRDNVFLNGALLGFDRKEMTSMYDDIVSFAELEEHMDVKLKNFSSGMQVRLAFSIAIRANAEILLIDEVLAVGDAAFQKKCFDVFRQLKKEGRTIVLVTHDMGNVERFCDRALVIDQGKVLILSNNREVSKVYARLNIEDQSGDAGSPIKQENNRWGTGGITVKSVQVMQSNKATKVIESGEQLKVHIKLEREANHMKDKIVCGLAIFNSDEVTIVGPNSISAGLAESCSEITMTVPSFNFSPGEYKITTAIYDESLSSPYDLLDHWTKFSVVSDHVYHGITEVENLWESK